MLRANVHFSFHVKMNAHTLLLRRALGHGGEWGRQGYNVITIERIYLSFGYRGMVLEVGGLLGGRKQEGSRRDGTREWWLTRRYTSRLKPKAILAPTSVSLTPQSMFGRDVMM